MNDNPTAVWRAAMNDENHPLNRAVWLLFTADTDPDYAAYTLINQKDALLPYLYQIIDTQDLYDEASFGGGHAPIHAVELLGRWQVVEAAPRLFAILEDAPWDSEVYKQAVYSLAIIGPQILDQVLDHAEQAKDIAMESAMAVVLGGMGQGNERAYAWVKACIDAAPTEQNLQLMSLILLQIDPRRAIPFLEKLLKQRKYSAEFREELQEQIEEARAEMKRGAA